MTWVGTFDVVFISYDEPRADELFEHLTKVCPRPPKRIHGVKGFDNAHKAAARIAEGDRFITVDGDNLLRESFFGLSIPDNHPADYVYSYNALNTVNGLVYGNGSVKIWPRDLVLKLNTHENIEGGGNDFCWTYRYYQVNQIASDVHFNQSPYHAFRAGYREAVKLSLVRDQKLSTWAETLEKAYQPNIQRLMIWATVGQDSEHGSWSIAGALLALFDLWLDNINPRLISDYDWFLTRWERVKDLPVHDIIDIFGRNLKDTIGIDLPKLDAQGSRWFKQVYFNVPREDGLMLPNMESPL